jgi:hypothetical protein
VTPVCRAVAVAVLLAVVTACGADEPTAGPAPGTPAATGDVTPSAPVVTPSTGRSCRLDWTTEPKQHAAADTAGPLTGVRGGEHECFDRLVFDVAVPGTQGYLVRYVGTVRQEGSGAAVPLRGGARLEVVVMAPAYVEGRTTYQPVNPRELVDVSGWRAFRQVAWAGSFEGQTTVGLGVQTELPFRVLVTKGPERGTRIVVDVAHEW